MLIFSQNLTNYDIPIPDEVVYRINLAWINDLAELEKLLKKYSKHDIFLDLPIRRIKPPHNFYNFDKIIPFIFKYPNIRYLAISNVDSSENLDVFLKLLPDSVILIPKIESLNGILNIEQITKKLPYQEKIIMLDHDDLFSDLLKNENNFTNFKKYFTQLVEFCNGNNIKLLRTIGVVFSDDEKRVTQYIG